MPGQKSSVKEEKFSGEENNYNDKDNPDFNQHSNNIQQEKEILLFSEKYGIQLKVPAISVVLSGLFPGLGQVYNGDSLLKGLLIFFGTTFGFFIFLIPGLIVWIYGMYDAWKKANGINSGLYEYKPAKTADLIFMVIIPLIVMVILMVLSIYAMMQFTEIPYELTRI
ncbi:zinc ribbon domain-containing protein [Methanoplanus endosymbiosus]|uniref:Zinc ribbon domain-containing protein n=1 Tax=Methanoplanus endosymbiosus TaxID=33865 RepID=A0A9E7TLW3_9EURY|nr:zinc ribbon domain-containing protein [Methanoplanus endosymbiosus]UUX92776.1 zinc ribbon domain-containing protein [Methanoplanus endosymbiosus]